MPLPSLRLPCAKPNVSSPLISTSRWNRPPPPTEAPAPAAAARCQTLVENEIIFEDMKARTFAISAALASHSEDPLERHRLVEALAQADQEHHSAMRELATFDRRLERVEASNPNGVRLALSLERPALGRRRTAQPT